MPDSALTQPVETPELPQLILEVPEPVWKKISQALQVQTRQEAVQIVQADESAAAVVRQIILTAAQAKSESALTTPIAEEPLAERLYGGGGKARLRIG